MELKEIIKDQYTMLDRGIVATPTTEYLEQFTKANNGTSDFLLMQMAKNLGYKLALDYISEQLNK